MHVVAILPVLPVFQMLLKAVCGLSYHGDIRMAFAEDPHKIGRIVMGSREGLEANYLPLLTSDQCSQDTPGASIGPLSNVIQVGERCDN